MQKQNIFLGKKYECAVAESECKITTYEWIVAVSVKSKMNAKFDPCSISIDDYRPNGYHGSTATEKNAAADTPAGYNMSKTPKRKHSCIDDVVYV